MNLGWCANGEPHASRNRADAADAFKGREVVKRILACIVAGLLLCGTPASGQQAPDALGRIKAAKAINVGYSADSLPFSFQDKDKQPAGFSIDLCKRVIAAIARSVGEPDLKVNWVPGTVSERLQMVSAGKLDLECANTTRTLSRLRDVDFSSLVFIDSAAFLVRSDARIASLADLQGRKIAVIKGTTTEQRLLQQLKARLVNAEVLPVRDAADGLTRLESGFADAFASDKIKLVGVAAQSKAPEKLTFMQEDFSFEPYAFALPRGDASLRYGSIAR
jgi:ABC-type amino acid transport substrate-binding protein